MRQNPSERWLRRALELAQKGRGRVSPNPLVGAVVVRKGRRVAEGYHPFFGGDHAEIVALRKAGRNARGGTLYVTLEPCSSWGKTPPCVEQVIRSGITRVVIGAADPNPKNRRRGIRKLREAGIRVSVGWLEKEVEAQNAPFFKVMRTGLPYVTLKMAQSLDGKIAARTGDSRWISSPEARRFVHRLRDRVDAVLVGKNTALIDNPSLEGTDGRTRPWRIVLDPDLKLSPRARVFQGGALTFLAVSERTLKRVKKRHFRRNAALLPLPETNGRLSLRRLFRELVSLGVQHLLVEGGGELAWGLLEERLVDHLIWIVAPKIIGGREAKTSVEGAGIGRLSEAIPLSWEKEYRMGKDWIFEARPCLRES